MILLNINNSNFKDESLKITPNIIIQKLLSFPPVVIILDVSVGIQTDLKRNRHTFISSDHIPV